MPSPLAQHPLLEVQNLSVRFDPDGLFAVKGVSFSINRGECFAIVGESGSGKSVTSRTVAGLAGYNAHVDAARVRFDGEDLLKFSERKWRQIRGSKIGFVMQDALGSLDPLRVVGREIEEPLKLHTNLTPRQRLTKVIDLLQSVGVPEPEIRASQYPYQLSGGLRQRALIASAIACNSELLIADEPTTALDTTVQAHVLGLLESIRSQHTALLIISHDLAIVSRLADRIAVMKEGRIVEQGTAYSVLNSPQHPYTVALLRAHSAVHSRPAALSLGGLAQPAKKQQLRGDETPPLLEASGIAKSYKGSGSGYRAAVEQVSLRLHYGETLGIVGESGSGKTTTARLILGLEKPDRGIVSWRGRDWSSLSSAEQRTERRRVQVIFQDPLASFDPRYTVEHLLHEAIELGEPVSRERKRSRAVELLNLVRLDPDCLGRRPIEISGGQRQRVAIARALAPEPDVLVCDEPLSALDISVQAQILDLLFDLKHRLGLACLFISHDLGIVRRFCDRVIVMKDGRVVEQGEVQEVFDNPEHPHTRSLLNSIPRLDTFERDTQRILTGKPVLL